MRGLNEPGKAEYEALETLSERQLRMKARQLVRRLLKYRKAAAIMLADWHTTPADGFKEALRDKHMGLFRELINGDWQEQYGYKRVQVNRRPGRKPKRMTDEERFEAWRKNQREYVARRGRK